MAAPSVPTDRRGRSKLRTSLQAYGYIAPAIVALIFASFIPIVFTIYVAFTNWDLYHPALTQGFHPAGFSNFKEILDNLQGEVLGILLWTIGFATCGTVAGFSLGLFLAFLLNNPHMPERNFYRTVFILPWAVPFAILTLAWSGLLNTDYGPINVMLGGIHLGFFRPGHIPWLDDPNWARFSVIAVNTWFSYPFMMTACLGALQSIPAELGEAAQVDGAGIIVRFRRITFPLLRSATLPLVIGNFSLNLSNFGAIYFLTAGGPVKLGHAAGATDILVTYTYRLAIELQRYGLASAYSIVIFFFIGTLTLLNMKYTRAFEGVDR